MKNLLTAFALASLALLTGCGKNVWVKPGASEAEFNQANYVCLQQSQQGASSAYVNRNFGTASSGVVTNDGIYQACMKAAGWRTENNSQPQAVQQNQVAGERNKVRLNQLSNERREMCNAPEFQLYYAKSPCYNKDVTLPQMADKSKITPAEKLVLEAVTTKLDQITNEVFRLIQESGSLRDKQYSQYLESRKSVSDKTRLDLYEGKITWGQFNKGRKETNDAAELERKRIFSK